MSHGKLYRSFIILQEDEKGHSIANDKPLSGYAKVEVKNDKCKVAFYAQNLKKDYNKCNMILICSKKGTETLLNLGTMNITPQGKAECSNEFDANNIGNSGVSYDKIVGASLCRIDSGSMKSLMCGFLNGEKPTSNWKDYKMFECAKSYDKKDEGKNEVDQESVSEKVQEPKGTKVEETKSTKVAKPKSNEIKGSEISDNEVNSNEIKNEDNTSTNMGKTPNSMVESGNDSKTKAEENPVPKIETTESKSSYKGTQCPCTKSRSKYDEYDEYIDNSELVEEQDTNNDNREQEREEEIEQEEKKKREEERKQKEEKRKEEEREKEREQEEEIISKYTNLEEGQIGRYTRLRDDDDFELRGSIGEFFSNIVESLEETRGSKEVKKCKWYKVPVKSFDAMCNIADYNKYTALYYPMTNYYPYISKEGHFLIGLKCDEYGNVKYLVYGIKGGKDKKHQPYDGKTGFVTWMPESKLEKNMGYWLMFYDFKSNVIVVPSK